MGKIEATVLIIVVSIIIGVFGWVRPQNKINTTQKEIKELQNQLKRVKYEVEQKGNANNVYFKLYDGVIFFDPDYRTCTSSKISIQELLTALWIQR